MTQKKGIESNIETRAELKSDIFLYLIGRAAFGKLRGGNRALFSGPCSFSTRMGNIAVINII